MAYYGYSSYEYNEPQQQMQRYGGSYNSSMAGKQAPSESPWNSISRSNFPPGTDPKVVKAFQAADVDGNGFIDVMELKRVLSSITQTNFSQRTIRLMISTFTRSNTNRVGPKEFMSVFEGLKTWLNIFHRHDQNMDGTIDATEMKEALNAVVGLPVSPNILNLLLSKDSQPAILCDKFIEYCLVVKGLTEKFKDKDTTFTGNARFAYEDFMLSVLPFVVA